jgi:AcrR family transcriptional regulator
MNRERRQNIKEIILEESIRLFLANSFCGTPVKDITDAAQIGKGTLYWYFKSKEEILKAIIDRFEQEFLDGLIESVNSVQGGFIEKYKRYHKHVSAIPVKMRDLSLVFTTLSAELSGSGLEAEARIRSVYGRYHDFVKELLEEGKMEGKVKKGLDIDIATHVIIGFHDGIFLEWYRNYDKIDGRGLARTFREIVLKGISEEGSL